MVMSVEDAKKRWENHAHACTLCAGSTDQPESKAPRCAIGLIVFRDWKDLDKGNGEGDVPMPDETQTTTVGANVKRVREEKGFSKAALARKADMDVRTLRSIETGEQSAHLTTIYKLAAALDVPANSLDPRLK